MKALEEENRKLKRFVVDLSFDKVMLQDVLSESAMATSVSIACCGVKVGKSIINVSTEFTRKRD